MPPYMRMLQQSQHAEGSALGSITWDIGGLMILIILLFIYVTRPERLGSESMADPSTARAREYERTLVAQVS